MKNFKGKTIVFEGDSICEACADEFRGWAGRVGDALGMTWYNCGVSGATVTAELFYANGDPRHWVCRSVDEIKEKYGKVDYIIFEGGTNDADNLGIGSERTGTLDEDDFSGNYDDSTFIGAMESMFYRSLMTFPETKIGFIIAQKMNCPTDADGKYFKRRHYFKIAEQVCKKWGVPCLNLWDNSQINPSLPSYYDPSLDREGNLAAGKVYLDGQHLSPLGYAMISGQILSFVESL
mgnify:CR=1 FL=1